MAQRKKPEELRWGTRIEEPGVMDLVTTDAVIGLCDASFKSSSTLKTKLPERPDTVQFSLDGQIAVATFSESKEFVVFNVEEDRMMLESDGKE